MAMKVTKVDVWAVEFRDEAGGLAHVLAPVAAAGANLECIIARRQADKFQAGLAFVTPIKGKKAQAAARAAGMEPAEGLTTLRVEGLDTPGSCARLSTAIAQAGVNMRGLSSMSAGKNFVAYIGLDSEADAATVIKILGAGKKSAKKKRVRS